MEGSTLLLIFSKISFHFVFCKGQVQQMPNRQDVDSICFDSSRAGSLVELQAAALEATANAVVITDQTGTVFWVNSAFEQLTGYTAAEMVGQSSRKLKSGRNSRALYEEMWRTILGGRIWRGELINRRKDGSLYDEEMTITPVRDTRGEITHFIAIKLDVSERKQAEAKHLLLTERLSLATAVAKVGVWELDLASSTYTWDATTFEIYGFPPVVPMPYEKWSAAVYPQDLPAVEATLRKAIDEKGQGAAEFRIILADGTLRHVSAVGRAVLDENSNVSRVLGVAQDITERKQAEERTVHLAHYDALTDLPNRALLLDRLNQLTKAPQRRKSKVGVVFIDLDRFKEVNDSLGHDAGDLLLQTIAKRLSKAVRDEDTVARIGGDEFVVVLKALHEVRDVAVIAQKLLSCLVEPVTLNGYELTITASMGISLYPDDATNGQEMIRNADAAMYQAKSAGRNGYQFYTSDLNRRALEMLSMENALRRAIERQEFVLHYQPQVDISSGCVVGAEALIRWNHPDLGLVMPGKFISIAEERGLIVPIGSWVIEEAARQAAVWQNVGTSIPIAVNVSAVQFRQKDFVEQLANSVRKHRITPNHLELELTESVIMRDAETTVDILERLHDMGFRLSIDDFGTGYSSLSYLRRFPIDKIKIDQSFVTDESAGSIVTAVIGLARSLKLKVIAEGVETEEQLGILREQLCDEAQGFLFSPALGSEGFEKLVREWKPKYLGSPVGPLMVYKPTFPF